jgi:hypothetical protein
MNISGTAWIHIDFGRLDPDPGRTRTNIKMYRYTIYVEKYESPDPHSADTNSDSKGPLDSIYAENVKIFISDYLIRGTVNYAYNSLCYRYRYTYFGTRTVLCLILLNYLARKICKEYLNYSLIRYKYRDFSSYR